MFQMYYNVLKCTYSCIEQQNIQIIFSFQNKFSLVSVLIQIMNEIILSDVIQKTISVKVKSEIILKRKSV